MPNVSVVVVSYNTKEKLRRCLQALFDTSPSSEVIVVDNASSDGSPEMVAGEFPGAKLIKNSTNRGFGAANNQGIGEAAHPLVLLLNSDAYAQPRAIERLSEVFADRTIVAVGGKLINPDGSLQESCANSLSLWAVFCEQTYLEKLLPGSRLFSPYWMSRRHLPDGGQVEQVMGACLMLRPLELFDERFFLYCEDTELCKRLRQHGKIQYVPEAEFIHELGSSSSSDRSVAVARYNHGKELYFRIHSGRSASIVCWVLDRFGAFLRLLVWGVLTVFTLGIVARFRKQAATFAKVLFAPMNGPPRL